MRRRFTKMQGAGNDFIVLDATREPLALTPPQVRRLADRHFGIGADQILVVEPAPHAGADFGYRIYNSSGDEVEHCGNGARCFVRYVRDHGLTAERTVRVQTMNNLLVLTEQPDGQVSVDMNRPVFDAARVPFEPPGSSLAPDAMADSLGPWRLPLPGHGEVDVAVLSMGNPHAVLRVADTEATPVAVLGPQVQALACFPRGVNVGFLQVLSRTAVNLRVYERGAGETLACGTGACAAVVAGIRLGWLDDTVRVAMRGGALQVHWPGRAEASVLMTGPAQTVFEGEIEL